MAAPLAKNGYIYIKFLASEHNPAGEFLVRVPLFIVPSPDFPVDLQKSEQPGVTNRTPAYLNSDLRKFESQRSGLMVAIWRGGKVIPIWCY